MDDRHEMAPSARPGQSSACSLDSADRLLIIQAVYGPASVRKSCQIDRLRAFGDRAGRFSRTFR
jgi:hypothetical protein